jgi:hypothetical protein
MQRCMIWKLMAARRKNHAEIFRRYRGVNAARLNAFPISV